VFHGSLVHVRRLILGLAIGGVLAGCSSGGGSGSSGTRSYNDGFSYAQVIFIQQGRAMIGGPAAQCAELASQGSVPGADKQNEWEAGCQAALANAPSLTTPTSG
jgi:hypothetical protein